MRQAFEAAAEAVGLTHDLRDAMDDAGKMAFVIGVARARPELHLLPGSSIAS